MNQTGITAHEVARRLRLLEVAFALALGWAAGFAPAALGLAAALAAGFGAPRDFTALGADGFALGLDFVLLLPAALPAGLPEAGACDLPPEP